MERLVSTIQSLWITLGMQPSSELDDSIRRSDIAGLMTADRFQRVKSKELVVHADLRSKLHGLG